ncbi:MAG: hypothetical protein HQK54_15650, partial [Oligoflexales bacterium]|nr:hypothetical protein [Oligoflexales bacterium]
ENSSDKTYTRTKLVTSSAVRTRTALNKNGEEVKMELSIATKEGAPLAVTAVRSKATHSLVAKTITSGTLVSTRKSDGRVESSFENLKMDFTSDKCELASGSITSSIYKEGSSEPVRVLKLTVENGDYTLMDITAGKEIEDFEMTSCSIEDFADSIE